MQRNENNENKVPPNIAFTFFGPAVAGALAGAVEIVTFHPGDTAARRLQKSKKKILVPRHSVPQIISGFTEAIFGPLANQSLGKKVLSLYSGIGFASIYKVSQTTLRFGGQATVKDYLKQHYGHNFSDSFIQGIAGGIVGVAETLALAPIENLKVKWQVDKASFHSKGLAQVLRQEGVNLYNGTLVTMFRNVPASFIMFSFSSLIKEKLLGVTNQATLSQNAIGASSAALVTVIATNPMDVIKTRVQMKSGKTSTFSILKELIVKEGPGAFFKGAGSKLLLIAPKTTVTMTLAQTLPGWLSSIFSNATTTPSAEKESENIPSSSLRS